MSKTDASLLQVWTNTVLGEPFERAQETVEGSSLLRRGENYGPQSIPDAVKLLTAGVDVQGDRIEVQILGFGAFEETWAIRYEVLPDDPAQRDVWDLLDNVLTRILSHRRRPRIARARHLCRQRRPSPAPGACSYCRTAAAVACCRPRALPGRVRCGRSAPVEPGVTRGFSWSASTPRRTQSTADCEFRIPAPAISTSRSAALLTPSISRN